MSLSIQQTQSGSRLVLYSFPFRRVAVGAGLTIGLLIPWLFGFTEPPAARQSHGVLVTLAVAVLAVTVGVTRLARYQFFWPSGKMGWWSASLFGVHWGSTTLDLEKLTSELQTTDRHGCRAVTLEGHPQAIELPLAWHAVRNRWALDRVTNFLTQMPSDLEDQRSPAAQPPAQQRPAQRSLLWLFSIMSLAAAMIAAARFASQEIISLGIAVFVTAIWVRSWWRPADQRSRIQAVLAAIYLPFVWIIAYNKPFGHTSGMLQYLPIAPSLIISMIVSAGNPQIHIPATTLLLVAEIGLATAIARRGPVGAIATLVVMLGLSGFASFVIHALYRM